MSSTRKKYIHEGWIHKWTNFIGSWRPRYFMLEPDCLSYSVEKDGVIKESFLLSHCKIRLCPDDPVRLDIEVVGSCLLCLRTDTPLEKHKWYVSFKRAQKLAFQASQKRTTADKQKHELADQPPQTEEHGKSTPAAVEPSKSNNGDADQASEKSSKNIANIFVKTKSGREPRSSLSYILDNTETFEHISSKILKELETTTDSESLKHLKTFRLILTDYCCSIKQLTEEEFRPGEDAAEKYYPEESLEVERTESQEAEDQNVPNLFSDRSVASENRLYNESFYECEQTQAQDKDEQLSETYEDSDTSEELMDEGKQADMLDYHEFTIDTKGQPDPDQSDPDKDSDSTPFNIESRLLETPPGSDLSDKPESESAQAPPELSLESKLARLTVEKAPDPPKSNINRRTKLPHARLEHKVSVWSILKDFIGKDLSRIRMPIVFNEPTSNLQRSAEDFTYYKYLNEATAMEDPIERLANVTVFSITPYSSAVGRSYKPFNPLLGETFEINHAGFNYFAEQVAHHPPILAFHCFNDKFESSGSLNMVINFTGKAIEANVMGPFIIDLKLPGGMERYNLQRCNMMLHNLIFGKMWIEAVGYVVIRNVTNGDFSVMQYLKKGWFNKEIHKVRGLVFDKFGTQHYHVSGIWSKHIFIEKVYSQTAKSKQKLLNDDGTLKFNKNRYKNEADAWDAFVNEIDWDNINVIPGSRREAWKPDERPPNNEEYYGFGYLTMQLNELSEDYDRAKGAKMPKTDSRYRPDQRMYEEGKIDMANEEKKRLEDKQRAVAKHRADNNITYKPFWFTKVIDPATHQANWIYNGNYWDKKRDGTVDEGTPDIFG